ASATCWPTSRAALTEAGLELREQLGSFASGGGDELMIVVAGRSR
ncbi:MAG: hypothetical protein HC927_09870, partial [Deltaproteobacteria bacterium]|nr:hypothetical protein [Deltaproteobacteria bacterium]